MPYLTRCKEAKETQVFNAVIAHDVTKFREVLKSGLDERRDFVFLSWGFWRFNLLKHAVESDFREGIQILLRETSICTGPGFTEACKRRNRDVIRLFLYIACEMQTYSSEYFFILLKNNVVDMARDLIQIYGFNVNDRGTHATGICKGLSPMHIAAHFQQPQLLEHLIKRGGKLDIMDMSRHSPLYFACRRGSYECCLCLLRHGAKPAVNDSTKHDGATVALSLICALSPRPELSYNDNIIELLLSAGLDMNKERWILEGDWGLNVTDDTLRLLKSLCAVPSTLETICVRAIRLHLSKLTTGKSILPRVQGLPVPLLLRARLTVSDFEPRS